MSLFLQSSPIIIPPSKSKVAPLSSTSLPQLTYQPSSFQQEWLSNADFDNQSRSKIIKAMNCPQSYDSKEKEILNNGMALFNMINGLKNLKTFKTPLSAIQCTEVFLDSKDGDVCGRVIAECMTTPENAIAYLYDFLSKVFEAERRELSVVYNPSDYQRLESVNDHHTIDYLIKHHKLANSRSFLIENVYQRIDSNTILFVQMSLDKHVGVAELPGSNIVRGHSSRVFRFNRIGDNKTKIEFVYQFNLNGLIPSIITNQVAPGINVEVVVELVDYFQHLQKPALCDATNGRNMAEMLLIDLSKAKKKSSWKSRWTKRMEIRNHVINVFVDKNEALRSCEKIYPWIRELLTGLISNMVAEAVSTIIELVNLTPEEAHKIGAGFSKCLKGNKNAEAGVAVWLGLNPSMKELSIQFPFLMEMITVIGRRKLKEAPWGMKWRVGLGASLSTLDMATDIYALVSFYEQGNYGYAQASLAMIGTCLLIGMLLVFINCRQRVVTVLMYEWMIVFSCMKPAVDAYRVTSGAEKHDDHAFDPFYEMMIGKQIEIFFEAIPACILQSYAYLNSDRTSLMPLISIAVSILSIAYSSTMVSYDTDISPAMRKANPLFYGYIPENGNSQFIIFSSMFLATSFQVVLQVLCIVLLASINGIYAAIYLSVDAAAFFMYKSIRQDLRYWVNLNGAISWIMSILARLVAKLNTDFTMNIHFRHIYDLGGMYWSLNLGIHHIAVFVSTYLYLYSDIATKVEGSTLWGLLIGVEMSFLFFFLVFLMNINPKYLFTFFTTATAKATAVKMFHSSANDAMRINIFNHHPSYYASICEELKDWVGDNWNRWNTEKEEWFTSKVIANIPNEFIPKEDLKELEKNGRRKSSALERLFGGGQSTEVRAVPRE